MRVSSSGHRTRRRGIEDLAQVRYRRIESAPFAIGSYAGAQLSDSATHAVLVLPDGYGTCTARVIAADSSNDVVRK
jgi:hypothetical protein